MEVVASPLLDDHYSWEDVPTSCSSERRGQTRRHGGEDEIACALDLIKLGSCSQLVLLLQGARLDHWCVALLDWPAGLPGDDGLDMARGSLQGQGKRMVHRRRESLHSCCLLDPLIFCNHGRVMGRFASQDWEQMVFGPFFSIGFAWLGADGFWSMHFFQQFCHLTGS